MLISQILGGSVENKVKMPVYVPPCLADDPDVRRMAEEVIIYIAIIITRV